MNYKIKTKGTSLNLKLKSLESIHISFSNYIVCKINQNINGFIYLIINIIFPNIFFKIFILNIY